MKKINYVIIAVLTLILSLSLCVGLSACNNKNNDSYNNGYQNNGDGNNNGNIDTYADYKTVTFSGVARLYDFSGTLPEGTKIYFKKTDNEEVEVATVSESGKLIGNVNASDMTVEADVDIDDFIASLSIKSDKFDYLFIANVDNPDGDFDRSGNINAATACVDLIVADKADNVDWTNLVSIPGMSACTITTYNEVTGEEIGGGEKIAGVEIYAGETLIATSGLDYVTFKNVMEGTVLTFKPTGDYEGYVLSYVHIRVDGSSYNNLNQSVSGSLTWTLINDFPAGGYIYFNFRPAE